MPDRIKQLYAWGYQFRGALSGGGLADTVDTFDNRFNAEDANFNEVVVALGAEEKSLAYKVMSAMERIKLEGDESAAAGTALKKALDDFLATGPEASRSASAGPGSSTEYGGKRRRKTRKGKTRKSRSRRARYSRRR
jgi:hypothetical protein